MPKRRLTPDPTVSIIVPCYNEERTIGLLLQAVRDQTAAPETLEVSSPMGDRRTARGGSSTTSPAGTPI